MGPIGIVANPASGKDVRRLVARASVFDNQEKQAIVQRTLIGAVAAGARDFVYLKDRHGIVENALGELPDVNATPVAEGDTMTALDTISAARAMRDAQCSMVVTLGGDGTNRAFCLGWTDAPLLPISTGTNNVFPLLMEATVAGAAAGLVSSGAVPLEKVVRQQKVIEVEIDDEPGDIALIDAVLSRERFVGARALLAPEYLSHILLTRADPAAVGMCSVGGLVRPMKERKDAGLFLDLCGAESTEGALPVKAPIAPGLYQTLYVRAHERIKLNTTLTWRGPGVLAFDGERERVLAPGQEARLRVLRYGPKVLRIEKTLGLAAAKHAFSR